MRFGRVVRVVAEPGLHVKAPFDDVLRLDRRMTFSRPAPAEYLTVDKNNVVVESLATWRIADPGRFLATVRTRANADVRLADVMLGEIGSVLGTYPAAALIAPDGNRGALPRRGRRDPQRRRANLHARPTASRSSTWSCCT